jgi:hypothetical protein
MTRFSQLALLGVTTAGVVAFAPAAQAFTAVYSPITDTEFNQLILDGTFEELFVAESRFGNGQGNGDREFGINQPLVPNGSGGLTGGLPFPGAEGQRQWISGEAVEFSLDYNHTTGLITYTVGGQMLQATTSAFSPNGIFLRTRAEGRNADSDAFLGLSHLKFTDASGTYDLAADLGDLESDSSNGSRDVDYMVLSDLTGSFTLTGKETFSWEGATPNGSRLSTQIKVGGFSDDDDPESVPEPMALLGTVAAVGFGLASKRRHLA